MNYMTTPISKLENIKKIFNALNENVFHYTRGVQVENSFIEWAETTIENIFYSDNSISEYVWSGTLDFYTKTEFDPTLDLIFSTLNQTPFVRFELISVQYEEDTTYIHYEFSWQA